MTVCLSTNSGAATKTYDIRKVVASVVSSVISAVSQYTISLLDVLTRIYCVGSQQSFCHPQWLTDDSDEPVTLHSLNVLLSHPKALSNLPSRPSSWHCCTQHWKSSNWKSFSSKMGTISAANFRNLRDNHFQEVSQLVRYSRGLFQHMQELKCGMATISKWHIYKYIREAWRYEEVTRNMLRFSNRRLISELWTPASGQ